MHTRTMSRLVSTLLLSMAVASCGAGEDDWPKNMEATFRINDQATPADVGLPDYPGAKPYLEDDDSHAGNIRISTPGFGVKVVAVELETADKPEKVAAFYKDALAKYGSVLECRDAASAQKRNRTIVLDCDDDEHSSHELVYKVGTEDNQRIVAIKPHGAGTQFSLVHVDVRD